MKVPWGYRLKYWGKAVEETTYETDSGRVNTKAPSTGGRKALNTNR